MPYAYSWYLDATTNQKWDALVFGDYEIVMPLPYNRKLLGFKQVYQPFFSQQLGIFASKKISSEQIKSFLEAIPDTYKRVYTQLNFANKLEELSGFELVERPNYVLSLGQDYASIRQAYSKGLKYNLKQAQKNELSFENISTKQFLQFYQDNPVEKGKGYNQKLITILKRLLTVLEEKKMGNAKGVFTKEGELCAAFFLLQDQKRLIYLLARSTTLGKEKKAMPFLIDSVIQDFAKKGNYLLDFEGSAIPSVAKFFKSFRAENEMYWAVKKEGRNE